uniref:Uncharacterized protein n=1 Tax=Heterosigma akashiwo TaxID=2829 RepID=A0A6S9EBA2_HETAK|mmetsp:Transcript_12200/g.19101  ORF Transcript_12200/g.19101 Transcript_12200/m.19101 type:complete len:258 (-) Transcript_12200:115-888(-)
MMRPFVLALFLGFLQICSFSHAFVSPSSSKFHAKKSFPVLFDGPGTVGEEVVVPEIKIDAADAVFDPTKGKVVTWTAEYKASQQVVEGKRSLDDYLALPPSQYSVLDEGMIQRLGENRFRTQVDPINMFGNKVIPVLEVEVDVSKDRPMSTLTVTKCEITGSEAADKANGTFKVESRTIIDYERPSLLMRKLQVDVNLRIRFRLPERAPVPVALAERTGNFLMRQSLKLVASQFVRILAKDYKQWSQGLNDDRKPVE